MKDNRSLRILNLEPSRISEEEKLMLSKIGIVDHVNSTEDFLVENIHKYDVLLIGLKNFIGKKFLQKAKKLKAIVTPTTGTNHIDVSYAKSMNIKIISLKDELRFLKNVTATAEHTFALMLTLVRKINSAHQSVIDSNWNRDLFLGYELKGKTIGIIGHGRLGKMVAKYSKAFGMNVLLNDIRQTSNKNLCSIEFLLKNSDIISIHVPLNDITKLMIAKKEFRKMKDQVVIINTSRGDVIDENEFLLNLKNKKILGAAVDVLTDEFSSNKHWLRYNKLRKYASKNSNLLITPHIGGATHESIKKANNFIINKLAKWKSLNKL